MKSDQDLPVRSRLAMCLALLWTGSRLGLRGLWLVGMGLGTAWGAEKPASYYHDVVPLLKRSCTGCHHPGKLKAKLDLTTYAGLEKGGKHGASFKPGDPGMSLIVEQISGEEPAMPEEGDPLTADEVSLIARWVGEGAKDDTPEGADSFKLAAPPVYTALPVVSTLAISPDGKWLAVSGYHEVLIHSLESSNLVARLVGESPRIESVSFSPDGRMLAVAGSAPARFGEVQFWDVTGEGLEEATNGLMRSVRVSIDSVYGISWSPTGDRVAVGCADTSVRVLGVADGKEMLRFDSHSDWVFATTFTVDGKRLLTGSRDRAMKLVDLSNGQFIDDVNKLLEPVLSLARHPTEDVVIYGGEQGTARIYKISDNQGRTAANNDVNLTRALERLPGPVQAVAYSADGELVAVGGASEEVRLYQSRDGKRVATLKGHEGAIFALVFHPREKWLLAGGFDGKVRIYGTEKGELVREFEPVPLRDAGASQARLGRPPG